MSYSTVRLCSGGGAFEAVPRPRVPLDLPATRERLVAAGLEVTDARVMLIVRLEREATISRDGRILIKTRDPGEANRVLTTICGHLGLEVDPAGEA